ncbi:MAG: hypothetical protein HY323_17425 [Betaproteobacteria bacterium]|nr:hypothetical protein [Betaproteobacteria bacterium]MBI3938754.1 hypothetical protein [Betaproteobacteria bacterium]
MNVSRLQLSLLTAACALLAGCAVGPARPRPAAPDAESLRYQQCAVFFARLDEAVEHAGVGDGMGARIAGFPYLRVSRFLASYAHETRDEARFAAWVKRLGDLGTGGYAAEIANLPAGDAAALQTELAAAAPELADLRKAVTLCTARLAATDLAYQENRELLRTAARVPDDYVTGWRIVGLYYLTRIPFAAGVRRYHEETLEIFRQPAEALPLYGELKRYVPPPGRALAAAEVAAILARSSGNALGIPEPRGADLDALFATFAPAFEVDTVTDDDRPGALGWRGGEHPGVDVGDPVVYRRVSHTRYADRALLQLVYSVWFPSRPKTSAWDLLGGHLDGVTWRVTLTPQGEPWVYDAMHNCGCFHMFFPTARAGEKPQPDTLDEKSFVPQRLPAVRPDGRLALRLEHRTHYLERVIHGTSATIPGTPYRFAEDDTLRSQPAPDGRRRSAFRADGIVPGSDRFERYFFWPMGIPAPGAMRQWGRHATAFVGRRHFDDAHLLEQYFVLGSNAQDAAHRDLQHP